MPDYTSTENQTNDMDELSYLNKFLKDYDTPVKITEGYEFCQDETINRIELYRASKFLSGDTDSQGNRKYFFNKLNPQAGNVTKNIDIDTSDVTVISPDGQNRLKSMLARELLKKKFKDIKFSVFLNKISETLPIYGSFVAKKTIEGIKYVPLKWIKFDPAVEDISKSPYIIEELYFQPDELEQIAGWDKENVKELVDISRKSGVGEILVYELHASLPNKTFGLAGDGYTKGCVYIGVIGDAKHGYSTEGKTPWKVLYTKVEKKCPYKKMNLFSIDGRALGLGIFEMLFDAQERWNQMANEKSASMQISNKKIFQTRDGNVKANILTDLLNGDILSVKSEITPVAVEERNLSAYDREEANVEKTIRDNSAGYEIVTGEGLPSRTPFRLGQLMNENAGKIFEFIRENVGIFVKEIIEDWILPDFRKEIKAEQIFEVADQETIALLVEGDNNRRLNEAVKKYVMINGTYPTQQEVDSLKLVMESQQNKTEFPKIIENYLDFEFEVDVVITNENYNLAQKVESTSNFIQLLAQNPQAMQDPTLKKLIMSLAENVGISPSLISGKTAPMPTLGQTAPMGAPGGSPASSGMMGGTPMPQ